MKAPLLNARQKVLASRILIDDHYKNAPCHSRCGTQKNSHWSMAISVEHVKMCSPSPVMVTSTYEWKILEWVEKPQPTNKQTNKVLLQCMVITMFIISIYICLNCDSMFPLSRTYDQLTCLKINSLTLILVLLIHVYTWYNRDRLFTCRRVLYLSPFK